MSPEISERAFEDAIECALLQHGPDACAGDATAVRETSPPYGETPPGGYRKRRPEDYDRALCLLPRDVVDFVLATQPKEWKKLEQHHGAAVREQFLKRLAAAGLARGNLRVAIAGVLVTLAVAALTACRSSEPTQGATRTVTVYVSTDRVFSEPVLRAYEQRSGVTVRAVYDTEETKSTGLANRLIAETARPQADVFWSNEPIRTLVLKSRNVLAPYRSTSAEGIPAALVDPDGYWTGFSARIRVIAYNTKLVTPEEAPQSVFELADPKWRDQVAIADPRFGSTSFHAAALYAQVGDERMDDFFRRLKTNGVRVVDGNSVVRDLVARGEVKVGLTDTDDVNVAIEDGQPVGMVLPDRNGLGVPVMPNMVSLVANGPQPEEGRRLIDYLLSADVERQLAQSEAVQIPLHAGVPGPKNIPPIAAFQPMTLDYSKAASRVEDVTRRLATILGL